MNPVYVVDGARTPFLKAKNRPGVFSAGDLATQAGKTLLDLKVAQLKKQGKQIDAAEESELLASIKKSYTEQTDPRYAAARLWIDGLIEPAETRTWLALGLEMAAQNPEVAVFKTGVLQV